MLQKIAYRERANRVRAGASATIATLALVACGGGEDSSSSSESLAAADPAETAMGAQSCASRSNNTFKKLLECVTVDGVRAHQAALQAFADANGGTRVSGSPGYDQSAGMPNGCCAAPATSSHDRSSRPRPLSC